MHATMRKLNRKIIQKVKKYSKLQSQNKSSVGEYINKIIIIILWNFILGFSSYYEVHVIVEKYESKWVENR